MFRPEAQFQLHKPKTFIVALFSAFLLPPSPCFMRFLFIFYGLPSSEIGFLSCFSLSIHPRHGRPVVVLV